MAGPWEQYGATPNPDGPWAKFQEIKQSQKTREEIQRQVQNDPISAGARMFPKQEDTVAAGAGSVVDKTIGGMKQLLTSVGAPQVVSAYTQAQPEKVPEVIASLENEQKAQVAAEAERRRLNIPLEQTPGGRIGQVAGEIGMLAPTTLIPGATTVRGATMTGGVMGAAQPVTGNESRAFNTVAGAGTAAGGTFGLQKLAGALTGKVAERNYAGNIAREQNAARDAIIGEAKDAGFVIPPASVNPSFLNTTLESIGGKVGTERAASITNQKVINQIVRDELGLPQNAPITSKSLESIRSKAGEAYADVANLSPEAKKLVQDLRDARFEARQQQKYYDRSANPDAERAARAARERAAQIENDLETWASAYRQPDLVQKMRDARALIAKTHNIEDALSAGGNVDARKLGKSDYLSGGLKQIGDMADQFPKSVQLPEAFGSPNVSAGKAFASALSGAGGGAALGPAGVAAAALPFVAPPAARSIMFSNAMQKGLGPEYGASGMLRLADALANNQQLQKVLPSLAIPYLPQVQQ